MAGSQWTKAAHHTRKLADPNSNFSKGTIQRVSSFRRCQKVTWLPAAAQLMSCSNETSIETSNTKTDVEKLTQHILHDQYCSYSTLRLSSRLNVEGPCFNMHAVVDQHVNIMSCD